MKKMFITGLWVTALFLCSCSKSNEEEIDPPPPPGGNPGNCDTANMKYTANIVPILQANCYSCHGTASSSGGNGIVLEGYANLKAKADAGTLIGVITHAAGFPAMPQNGPKLSACNINKIRSWINNGTKDN